MGFIKTTDPPTNRPALSIYVKIEYQIPNMFYIL